MRLLAPTLGVLPLLLPAQSQAHIKWFCAYDTTVAPLPIAKVLTPTFLAVAVLFCALMFTAYVVDRTVNATQWAQRLDNRIFRSELCTTTIIRIAVGILFVILWYGGSVILTPELKTASPMIPWVQLAIAASMLSRRALKFGAAGIMALYIFAVQQYGAFHLMDYPIFPALALYLALTGVGSPQLRALRMPLLYAGIAITMMWGAIEKFGYPYWTFPLLAEHPQITFGLGFDQFMCIAGFVELSLAFFMVTGTALLRLSCAVLLTLLAGAVPEFGKIDAIGHLLIMAGLVTMIIAGQRTLQLPARLVRSGVLVQAGTLTVGYSATVVVLFALYYSSQFIAGR
jgi:hypothetical protein